MTARCVDCGVEYPTTAVADEGLCPRCQRVEDAVYANDPRPFVEPELPWRWSKAAMRERLAVTGNEDV